MLYSYDLVLPANTTKTAPVTLDCPVSPGILSRVVVVFPSGHAGLTHLRIMQWSHQLYPTNEDGSLSGDGEVLDWPEELELRDSPLVFRLVGWNDDDTYQHTITVRLDIIKIRSVRGIPRWLQRLMTG